MRTSSVTLRGRSALAVSLCLPFVAVAGLARPAAGAEPHSEFSHDGIAFAYPSPWHVSVEPLSNGLEPVYRFAVGNFRFHRTSHDIGPCLSGIAGQRPANGVLVFLREAVGTDARVTRAPARPAVIELPARSEQAACLGRGTGSVSFRQAGRVVYLWISVGPRASNRDRADVVAILKSLTIMRR
jgi:hypothetical protein